MGGTTLRKSSGKVGWHILDANARILNEVGTFASIQLFVGNWQNGSQSLWGVVDVGE